MIETSTGQNPNGVKLEVMAISICMVINMLDGFDVLAIAFAAPGISSEWNLGPKDIGALLSSGLVGMGIGSLFLAPLADKFGRRIIILVCLMVISIGMLGSALAANFYQMSATRVFTGLGIGGMLASLNTIVSEYSSKKWRELAVSVMQTGYPIGATIGGVVAAYLVTFYDWRAIFYFGSLMSFIMIPFALKSLPEPKEFLREVKSKSKGILAIVSPELRARTFSLWVCFFMVMFTFYFLLSWTPKIMTGLGVGEVGAINSGVLMNVGGIIGAVILGYLASKFSPLKLIASYMVLCVVMMIGFGAIAENMNMLLIFVFLMGFFVFGSMIGLYTQVPAVYPAHIRNTGTGWAIGVGRLGAIFGPISAGMLMQAQWGRLELFTLLGLPLLISAFVIIRLKHQ